MRIFTVGAEGAISPRLATRLINHGHQVVGTHMSPGNAGWVQGLSAGPAARGQPSGMWRRIAGSS
jgi:hypothetical protein